MNVLGTVGFAALVAAAGATSYLFRASFVLYAHRLDRLSERARLSLQLLGPAAVGALIGPRFVRLDAPATESLNRVLAGVLAGYVAWRTRSVILTMTVGLCALLLMQSFFSN